MTEVHLFASAKFSHFLPCLHGVERVPRRGSNGFLLGKHQYQYPRSIDGDVRVSQKPLDKKATVNTMPGR